MGGEAVAEIDNDIYSSHKFQAHVNNNKQQALQSRLLAEKLQKPFRLSNQFFTMLQLQSDSSS